MIKQEFINNSRELIANGKTDKALTYMRTEVGNIDPSSVNDITLLESRYTKSTDAFNRGDIMRQDYDPIVAQITLALLEILENLEKSAPLSTGGAKNKNSGRILHNIPGMMPIGVERRCIVRIAYDDETLLRDLEKDENTTIQSVRIAEVMGVELVDDNETPAFSIRTITEEEQFISSDDYTQWLFKVKALREGRFPLTLKVAVIEVVNGQPRKREIVLEKEVFIISQIEQAPAAAAPSPPTVKDVQPQPSETRFEDSTIHFNYVSSDDKPVAVTSQASRRFSFSSIASTIAVIAMALTGWVAFQTFSSPKEIDVNGTKNGEQNGSNNPSNSPNKADSLKQLDINQGANPNQLPESINKNDTSNVSLTKPEAVKPTINSNTTPTSNTGGQSDKTINSNSNIVNKLNIKTPNKGVKPPSKVIAKPASKKPNKTTTKPPPSVAQPQNPNTDNTTVPPTGVSTTNPEPPAVVKSYRVRLILKGEMKKAQISVDGQSVDQYLKKNIWGTPQYIEFKSSKERHTITFKRGGVSCSITDVLIENGNMTVEPCSF